MKFVQMFTLDFPLAVRLLIALNRCAVAQAFALSTRQRVRSIRIYGYLDPNRGNISQISSETFRSIMSLHTVKNVAGAVAILGMYQFLHLKDPTFPSIFALIGYLLHYTTIVMIAFGGYYAIHQYIGVIKYTITEDILGMNTAQVDRFKDFKPTTKYTDQDSDPEDPANYTSIG